jgi:hypothetical protein
MGDPKMVITAYNGTQLSKIDTDSYSVLVNPDTYTIKHTINWSTATINGTPQDPKYITTPPPSYQFDFLFDATGVIPPPSSNPLSGVPIVGAIAGAVSSLLSPTAPYEVMTELEKFKNVVLYYQGDAHSPRKVNVLWGKLIFDGKLSSLSVNFKLFKPDGTPLRAVATASFIDSMTEDDWLKKYKPTSPDLTHIVQVMDGDTLPLMAYRVYGDPSYYLEVARVNNIVNFRNIKAGDRIKFPPINKTAK